MQPILEVHGLSAGYDASQILFDIAFDVHDGECLCLLGRNGMGKTTTIRSVMSLTRRLGGTIRYRGRDLGKLSSYEIARLGISLVPEDRRIFADLTVEENLRVADAKGEWTLARVYALFPELREFAARKGGLLSGGQQQMLTIGRSLMTSPRLLLLDEPSEGIAPLVVQRLRDQIIELKRSGLTLVLAEQSLAFCLAVSDRVVVLEKGHVRFTGATAAFAQDTALQQRLLGVGH
jgi:branched-chain amino acid transport system ATP-binding protein